MVDRSSPPNRPPLSTASLILRLAGIAVVVAAVAGAFAYVNGTFDPQRLTPKKLINVLETNNGVHPGFRRNHSKGVCVIGHFESSGEARSYSTAQVFNEAQTPVVGRFALPAGNPYAPDGAVPIRSMALRFNQANGQQWRTGMNSMPVFPVATPEAFYQFQQAQSPLPQTGKPDPAAVPAFSVRTRKPHPSWPGSRPPSRRPVTSPRPITASMRFIW
jgi:catalase